MIAITHRYEQRGENESFLQKPVSSQILKGRNNSARTDLERRNQNLIVLTHKIKTILMTRALGERGLQLVSAQLQPTPRWISTALKYFQ